MNRILLALFFVFACLVSTAQVASIHPNNGFKGQSLNTTITSSLGVISMGCGPYGNQDIYLQQGTNIIYCDPAFDPNINIYTTGMPWPPYFADSLWCTFNLPVNTPTGWYDVHVLTYDPWMTTTYDNTLLNGFYVQGSNAGTITGKVYFDSNQNGAFDVGEVGMANHRVSVGPMGITTFTDASGNYQINVDTGNYTLTYLPPANFSLTSSPASYNVSVPPSSGGNDFGTYSAGVFYGHNLSVWNHPMRCNTHGFTFFSTTNTGILPTQGTITLIHSSNLGFVSSVPMPDVISGDTLTWYYTNLQPGQTFDVGTSSGNWIVFNDPAAGQTIWYTVIDSVEDMSGNFQLVFDHPWSFTVTCSCDPNEKDVAPVGIGAPHYTGMNEYLMYTVNFQNTGNDTAFNVTIYDTLDADLDLNTFEILGSSDPVSVQMGSAGETQFIFNNILLPDSNVDEPGSHGFVNYRIRGKASLPDPTVITNTAHIVFDLNLPIVTNTAMNTLTNLQFPSADLNANVNTICANNCINFSATTQSGTTYQWQFPGGSPSSSTDPNPTVCYVGSGNFDVTLIATNPLGSDTLVQPNYILVNALPATPVVNQIGDSLVATTGYASYQWYYFTTPISGATSSSYFATQDGDYTLVVTNNLGCQTSVNLLNVVTGVSDVLSSEGVVKVYPNPSQGNFEVQFKAVSNQLAKVELLNSVGQLVYANEIKTIAGNNSIELNAIASGVYSLRFTLGNNTVVRKVVVE